MGGWSSFSLAIFLLAIIMSSIPVLSNFQITHAITFNQTEDEGSSPYGDIIRGGPYYSQYSDIEIQLPSGWSGLELLGAIMITPDGLEIWKHPIWVEASMIIVERDISELFEQNGAAIQESLSESLLGNNNLIIGHCEQQDYSYVTINGMEALQGISECTSDSGFYSKTKTYAIADGQGVAVILALTANSSQSFMQYEPVFDESVSTATIPNPVSFKEAMAEALNLNDTNYQVVVSSGSPVEVNIQSNSVVSNFNFSEATKQISFDVEGTNGTDGFAIITATEVLEPPYMITIDGQPTTDFFIFEDEIRNETAVEINYRHSSHHITIMGTNVVPEFQLHIVSAIAGVIGLVIIIIWNIQSKKDALF
ncbi:MAG: hypothetical protein AB1351_01115 [Thermoproteota archaeon]